MIYAIVILSLIVVILGYAAYNLLKKNEKLEEITISYESFINELSEAISYSKDKLDEIDSREVFKSDDEVGWFFNQVQDLQNILNNFNLRE